MFREGFNTYAETFEEKLANSLEYRTPEGLFDALLKFNGSNKTFASAIDLGFGTGLVGVAFKDLVDRVIGVDLSENMIKKAKEKKEHVSLYVGKLVTCIDALDAQYDLFISADVLIYAGALEALFESRKNHASDKALFVFSAEHIEG